MPAAADDEKEKKEESKIERVAREGDCACPKEGNWNAQNHKGWMNCTGPVNIKQTLQPVKDRGTIWVLDEKCDKIFSEASNKKDEDIYMEREADSCKWVGVVSGQTNGVTMVIDVRWPSASETFIEGDMHSKPNFQGMTCEYYRPYEIEFDEPLGEEIYDKRKEKMLKKLEKILANK